MIRFRAAVSNPLALIAILMALTLWPPFASPAYAFHFPWDQGHDTFSPTTPPDPGPCKGSNCNPCNSSSSPVYVPTGHFVWSDTDIVLRGRPYMGLTRTYNSNDPRAGLFGNGWSVGCDVGLYVTTSGSEMHFVYRAPDGKRYEYVVQPDGTVMSPPGRFEQILPQPDGTVQILYLDNTRQVFRADGRLAATLDANGNRIDYSYDSSDRLVSMADTNGRSLALSYNASGRVSRVTDHGARVWQYGYDVDGNLVAVTDPLGGVRRYEYGVFTPDGSSVTYHQLTKITDASGVVVTRVTYNSERVVTYTEGENQFTYSYNTAAKTVTKTDRLNSRWTFVYSDEGLIVRETDPLGNAVNRTFDASGQEIARTDEIGAVWASTYDTLGRRLTMTNPLGESITLVYSGTNPVPVRISSPSGRVIQSVYDARLNPLSTSDPSGAVTTLQWSSTGDLITVVDAVGGQFASTYNSSGLTLSTTDPLLRTVRWSYDVLGRQVSTQSPAGEISQFVYDSLDRQIQATDGLGQTTSYAYDPVGRITSVVDARSNGTTYSYDTFGRLATRITPDGRITQYNYRADNLLNQISLPDLRTIIYVYDAAKRVTQEIADVETTTYAYTARSELRSAAGPGGNLTLTYDTAGRLAQEVSNGQTVSSVFNSDGERIVLTTAGSSINYVRDSRGLMTGISGPAGNFSLNYDPLGRRTRVGYPNSASATYVFDAAGELSSIRHAGAFTANYDYDFDAAGRIVRQTGDGPDWQYGYDMAGRLVSASHGSDNFLYAYDASGNIEGGGRLYDDGDRLTEDIGTVYAYDLNGNLVRKQSKVTGAYTTYAWNSKNQLLRVERFSSSTASVATKTLVYTYDPVGRRASKTEDGAIRRYVYDGASVVATLDGMGNLVAAFTLGSGIDQPLAKRDATGIGFYHVDHVGSVRALTGAATVLSQYQYDPYGKTSIAGDGSDELRFTAREQDADDLYYYRARYYEPNLGRFLSEDPSEESPNPYSYVGNNPVNFTDPSGEIVNVLIGAGSSVAIGWLIAQITGDCYTWGDAAVDAATGAAAVGIFNKLRTLYRIAKLRSIAKTAGMAERAAQKGVERWAKEGAEIEIKRVGNVFGPGGRINHPGSWIPRARYQIAPGSAKGIPRTFLDPFNGETGPLKSAAGHIPLEATPGEAGVLGGAVGGASGSGRCGCRDR